MIRLSRHRRAVSGLTRQSLFMGLLVLAMLVRGLIPAGYMPSGSQAGQGLFPLELCTADNRVQIIQLSLLSDDATQTDTDVSPAMQDCVFASLGNLATHDRLHDSVLTVAPPDGVPVLATARHLFTARFITGAPLGSRAPPVA